MVIYNKIKCRICGSEQELHYGPVLSGILELTQCCFDCKFWMDVAEKVDSARRHDVIVTPEYEVMWACEYEPGTSKHCKGFGGDWIRATFNDGYVLTHDSWFTNGRVPERFQHLFKVNGTIKWISTEEALKG